MARRPQVSCSPDASLYRCKRIAGLKPDLAHASGRAVFGRSGHQPTDVPCPKRALISQFGAAPDGRRANQAVDQNGGSGASIA